jgi:phosphoribosylglycinamide formyltransferase 2
LSEFALHVRAILGLPIGSIRQFGPTASAVILKEGHSRTIRYSGLENAYKLPNAQVRLFGKPEIAGRRRLGVALASGSNIEAAVENALAAARAINVHFD